MSTKEKGTEKRQDAESTESTALETSDYEQKLVRKLDTHIVPVVMLLYLLSFLDR
jgi:hypothetical protein